MDYRDFFHLFENKDRLIDKLNLTDDQKARLKAYFKKYPTSESKIDWNRKDLKWEDFLPLLQNEGKSKSQAKKKGISGLKEGEDYEVIWTGESGGIPVTIYYPLSFLGSETLANPKVEPLGVTGKWCIAGGSYGPDNDDQYFRSYVRSNYDFFFIFTVTEKYAVARKTNEHGVHTSLIYFDSDDEEFEPERDVVIKGADGENHYIENFWEPIIEKIKDYPKTLTYATLTQTKEDGTVWSKTGETLFNAGNLEGWDEWILPKECRKILGRAFWNVNDRVTIVIPAGMEELNCSVDDDDEYGIFTGFRGTVRLEEGMAKVPDACFYNANDLTDILLPRTITEIGQAAFCSMEDSVFWGDVLLGNTKLNFKDLNLKKVGFRAFAHSKIRNFPFQLYPDCQYDEEAFQDTCLKNINLPEGIETLPAKMFLWGAFKGIQITLPKSLKSIGVNALGCLDQLEGSVRYRGTKEEWARIETHSWHKRSLMQPQVVWEPVTDRQLLIRFYCEEEPGYLAMDQEGSLYTLDFNPQSRETVWKLYVPHSMANYSTQAQAQFNDRQIIPLSRGPKL